MGDKVYKSPYAPPDVVKYMGHTSGSHVLKVGSYSGTCHLYTKMATSSTVLGTFEPPPTETLPMDPPDASATDAANMLCCATANLDVAGVSGSDSGLTPAHIVSTATTDISDGEKCVPLGTGFPLVTAKGGVGFAAYPANATMTQPSVTCTGGTTACSCSLNCRVMANLPIETGGVKLMVYDVCNHPDPSYTVF